MTFDPLYTVPLAALYVLALYNCFCVIRDRVSSGSAIAWILINVTLPVVGVPLYFLLGDFRIRGYARRYREAEREVEEGVEDLPPRRLPVAAELADEGLKTSVATYEALAKLGPEFAPVFGSVDLLIDGQSTFDAIFESIARAESFILVQYYILRSDRLGLELKRLLVEKARANIPVFLLYDDMGSFWLSRDYIKDMRAAGVNVARFLPLANFKRFFQLNFRNHRKLVIVDGHEAFTGGLNVGEEYATRRTKKKSLLRYWRDTHVRVSGDAVGKLAEQFREDWFFATEEHIVVGNGDKTLPLVTPSNNASDKAVIQIVPTGPTDETVLSVLFLMHVINSARKRLWIATPYFVPDIALVRALELALLRGVDVRIILPRTSDNRLVHWVSLSFAEQLQSKGALALLYEAGMMHQKVILADDRVAIVGTMNIDNRALFLNFETSLVIHDAELNRRVEEMLQQDFLACRFLTQEKKRLRRRFVRARASVARLFAPLL